MNDNSINRGNPSPNSKIDGLHKDKKINDSTVSVLEQIYGKIDSLNNGLSDISKNMNELNKNSEKSEKEKNNSRKEELKDRMKNDKSNRDDYKSMIKNESSFMKTTFDKFSKVIKNNEKSLMGIAGPINLLISPLSDFVGGFGDIFKTISSPFKKIFGKFTKRNPSPNDVMKSGAFGVGSLYIGNLITKLFGKDDDKKEKINKIKDFFGKFGMGLSGGASGGLLAGASKLKGIIGKVGGPLAIATALILMAIDAIKGIFKSKEWGTSKISSALGGFLGGASDGGLKNAFASMSKWALLGAGVGSVVPVIGTIAGGIVGGAIGVILGYIGGKNLAKGFDKLGAKIKEWFLDVWWSAIKEPFVELKDKIKDIWSSDTSLGKKIGKIVGEVIMYPINATKLFFIKNKKFFSNIFEKSKDFKKSLEGLGSSLIEGVKNFDFKKSISNFGVKFDEIWGKIFNFKEDIKEGFKESTFGQFIDNIFDKIKNMFGTWLTNIRESPIGEFVTDLFTTISNGITKFFEENPVGVWMNSKIIIPIQKGLSVIGDFFSYISETWDWSSPWESMSNLFTMNKKDKKTGLSKFEVWRNEKYENVDDAIIRADGSIIKTNPSDTLVALKNIPLSMNQIRDDVNRNLNSSLSSIGNDGLDNKLNKIIEVLSRILDKDVQINMPPQTRSDLDMIMSGGMI